MLPLNPSSLNTARVRDADQSKGLNDELGWIPPIPNSPPLFFVSRRSAISLGITDATQVRHPELHRNCRKRTSPAAITRRSPDECFLPLGQSRTGPQLNNLYVPERLRTVISIHYSSSLCQGLAAMELWVN